MATYYKSSSGKFLVYNNKLLTKIFRLEEFVNGKSITFKNGKSINIKVVENYHDNCDIQFSANFDLQLLASYGDGSDEITQHWGEGQYNFDINRVYIPGGDTLYFEIYDYDLYSANDYPWGYGEDEAAYIKSHGEHIGTLKLVELDPGNTGPDWGEFGLI